MTSERRKKLKIKGAIFDLDGVLVDTARFHYLAWKEIADELGIEFTEIQNERLKGVSRMASLEILLEIGHIELSKQEKEKLAEKKNTRYVQMLQKLTPSDTLPGVRQLLETLRGNGVRIALGSASKNAHFILEQLEIKSLFDVVVDGNAVSKAKPDPEVFLLGAQGMCLRPEECVVFEDSVAGIEAGNTCGMYTVGVGSPEILGEADQVVLNLGEWQGNGE